MRRLVPLATVALVLLSGCGTERPGAAPAADPSFSSAPAPSAPPTRTLLPSPTVDQQGSLAEFPLDLGYDEKNGDDGSPVTVTEKPATKKFEECGREVWDPAAGSGVIGVEFRGEAEWSRGRTLVLHPSTEAARAAVDTARDAITNCPRDDGTDYGWTEHTGVDYFAGEQSFGWIDRWWTTEVDGFDTGLIVYHVVRVGNAVLLSYEYGEGNGSEQTRQSALSRAAKEDQPVVDAMGELSPGTGAVALTPQGAGPLRLGMTAEQVRQAPPGAEIRPRPASCADLSWTSPDGIELNGAISDSDGLAFVSTPNGATREGIAAGDTLDDLRSAYPNLERADNGLWSTDQGATDYAFDVDAAGTITWAMVTGDDQQCAG